MKQHLLFPTKARQRPILPSAVLRIVIALLATALGAGAVADSTSPAPRALLHRLWHGAPDAADGVIGPGTTVFAHEIPGVANLDPALRAALRQAATDAEADGVAMVVTSGWRSPDYQEFLLNEAIATYGSAAEAARWVAPPARSAHVAGAAVDIAGVDATLWLSAHGAAYGLCQIYLNEPWHYELRPAAATDGCPAMYADPTQDPRLQP